jgi:oligoendopeptidase F
MFSDEQAWEQAYQEIERALPELAAFSGRLNQATELHRWFCENARIAVLMHRLYVYSSLAYDVDTADQRAAGLRDRALGLYARYQATTAFVEPELLALSSEQVAALLTAEPQLELYRHYLDNLQRQRAHVRSAEVEAVLAQVNEPLTNTWMAYQALADADLHFEAVQDSQGKPAEVARGTINELLRSPDRTLRKRAWESYTGGFLRVRTTLGALYGGSVKADVFRARVRGYGSAIEAALAPVNIPQAVYKNVIDACNRHLPIWHRYWDLRRRVLGLEQLESCDIFAPLHPMPRMSYETAVDTICGALGPLGEEYISISRAGLTSERWVDIYPNQGKTNGAYSGGGYDTPPYILMNYDDSLVAMSTLAHELGHSMHTLYSCRNQPPIYANYSIFVAEVASNFNQALMRHHLLDTVQDRDFRIGLLEEAMSNFHRYMFLMPILSQFEHHAHQMAEQGRPLGADALSEYLAERFRAGYGPAVTVDTRRDGLQWAQFPHLYENYYVFQYASGIAAATALAAQVIAEGEPAAARYRAFLATGASRYPLDALEIAGVDMSSPAPMDAAFAVLDGYVGHLEALLG